MIYSTLPSKCGVTMVDQDKYDPKLYRWEVSQKAEPQQVINMPDTPEPVELDFAITAWNLPLAEQRYADPDIRVRCYVKKAGDKWWCDVHVAQGVTAGMRNPNPELFRHNESRIAEVFKQSTGYEFPHHDVRLHTEYMQWVQLAI